MLFVLASQVKCQRVIVHTLFINGIINAHNATNIKGVICRSGRVCRKYRSVTAQQCEAARAARRVMQGNSVSDNVLLEPLVSPNRCIEARVDYVSTRDSFAVACGEWVHFWRPDRHNVKLPVGDRHVLDVVIVDVSVRPD